MKMKTTIENKCKSLRTWLYQALNSRIGLGAKWVQNHIAVCPRCQQRLASVARVELAFSIIKSQPHNLDLLMRANTQAIGVLKHSLRNAPQAQRLKAILPEPKLLERLGRYASPALKAAACLAILCLMKIGIFSSMGTFQAEGQKIVKNYYANNAGQDLADEIFSA
jgi:hypothetical protein